MVHKYKLTKEQFADAISKGLGRAALHVKHYGLDDVADILLDACLHNKVYDTQCEDSRGNWLYAMFSHSPQYNSFRDSILSALEKETNSDDIYQLCELVKEMALDGDEFARISLKEFACESAKKPNDTNYFGAEGYLKVWGEEALLDLARIYGQRLIEDTEDCVYGGLLCDNEARDKYEQLLKEHSYSDPRIKVYFDYLEENSGFDASVPLSDSDLAIQWENSKREFLSQYNAERIIDHAKNDKKERWYEAEFRKFGRFADSEELKIVFTELLNTKDDTVRSKLLKVFATAQLPAISECFFEWVDSDNEKLRAAVFTALANCKDDRIHDFARQRVKDGKVVGWANSFVLEIFEKNFSDDDAKLITDAILISKLDKEEDIHHIGLHVTGLAEKNKTDKLKEVLILVYENTPCSNCRASAVETLCEIKALPSEIKDECLYDGSEEIRDLAKNDFIRPRE